MVDLTIGCVLINSSRKFPFSAGLLVHERGLKMDELYDFKCKSETRLSASCVLDGFGSRMFKKFF